MSITTTTTVTPSKPPNRADGRPDLALRPFSCELSPLSNARGSAIWKSGGTTVLASCQGPTVAQRSSATTASSSSSLRQLDVSVILNTSHPQSEEWEVFLANTLQACIVPQHPAYHATLIPIVLEIASDDGAVLAACLHAAISALLDASIELLYLPVAVPCLTMVMKQKTCDDNDDPSPPPSPVVWLDPTADEELTAHKQHHQRQTTQASLLTLVVAAAGRVSGIHTVGLRLTASQFRTTVQAVVAGGSVAATIRAFWRRVLEERHSERSRT